MFALPCRLEHRELLGGERAELRRFHRVEVGAGEGFDVRRAPP